MSGRYSEIVSPGSTTIGFAKLNVSTPSAAAADGFRVSVSVPITSIVGGLMESTRSTAIVT